MIVTIAYYIAFAALGLVTASLGPTLPGLAAQTGTQIGAIGFLITARSIGYLFGSFFGGRFYDRVSGNPLMGGALIVMGVGMALTPFIPMLWVLTLILFMLGIGEGLLDVGGNTLIVWEHGKKVDPFMNALHFFFGVGAFLSPLIVAQMVLITGGIAGAYWLIALVVIPLGFWLIRVRNPVQPDVSTGFEKAARINVKLLSLVVLFFVLYVGAEVSYAAWVFTYAVEVGLANETTAAYLTSAFWVAFTISRLLSILIGARMRPGPILLVDIIGALISLSVVLLYPQNAFALWAGSIGFGFSIASIFPTMLTFAGRRMTISGKITGYFFLGATLGSMTLPWVVGQMIERVGPISMFWLLMGDMVLALGVLAALKIITQRAPRVVQ